MSQTATRARPRRTTVAAEEERAWVGFYQRVGREPSIAAEVIAELEADAEMKRTHLALYLTCRESLRRHEHREQRNARIGQLVRGVMNGLFIELPRSIGRRLRRAGDIAIACLPAAEPEPARAQVRRLAENPELRPAKASVAKQTSGPDDNIPRPVDRALA